MSPSFDPVEFIRTSTPGTVIYGCTEEEGEQRIDFLVRERSDVLKTLPKNPPLEFRTGALMLDHVFLVLVLFRFSPETPIYETFWNYHRAAPDEPNLFDAMCAEKKIRFNMFGESGEVENLIGSTNSLRFFFSDATQEAASLMPWTFDEFDQAKKEFALQYPRPRDVWEVLGAPPPLPKNRKP